MVPPLGGGTWIPACAGMTGGQDSVARVLGVDCCVLGKGAPIVTYPYEW